MNVSMLKFLSKIFIIILFIIGLIELGFALWTIFDSRYRSLAYDLANVGYIDLWILRYLSLCLFTSSIITLIMCLILIWGIYSAHVFLFIASTMLCFIIIAEFTISMLTFSKKYETRLTLIEQLPKLVITYRQGTDERAKRALDILQSTFYCCGSDGRLSFQNNVPLSCNMFSIGCLTRTMFFLDIWMDMLAVLLLVFSIIKLLTILFFYSYLCLNTRRKSNDNDKTNDYSLPIPIKLNNQNDNFEHKNEYVDNHEYLLNNYSTTTSLLSNNQMETTIVDSLLPSIDHYDINPTYVQSTTRKLSSISEKNETDDSETDVSYRKFYKPKRKAIITAVENKPPIAKRNFSKIKRNDENDSGVEYSSSEKSLDDYSTRKILKQSNKKISSPLHFSKVFITSVSDESTNEKKNLHLNDTRTPKSILKKSNRTLTHDHRPKVMPRTTSISLV